VSAFARGARAAFAFLTAVPLGGHPYEAGELSWAPAHFPLVGLVVGAVLSCAWSALRPLGGLADAVLVVALSLLLTGALHEDGLADTCDALGGAFDRDRVLEILKDSRVGTFGACALFVSLAGRAALLDRLGARAVWALPLVGCLARVGPVWLLWRLPYVSRSESAKSTAFAGAGASRAIVATGWALAAIGVAVALRRWTAVQAAASVVAIGLVSGFTARLYRARAGGVTGDFLGATEQLSELAAYVALALTGA
jgi:adenosylcobinamide-GDP ribazoletransferase